MGTAPVTLGTQRTRQASARARRTRAVARTRSRLQLPHHSEKAGLLALALSLGCFGAAVGLRCGRAARQRSKAKCAG